jgi:peptide-methionine (R)-S-oxide reductase
LIERQFAGRRATRRNVVLGGLVLLGAAGFAKLASDDDAATADEGRFPVMKTDAEWRQALAPEQYQVLRRHGTERPFSSPLNDEHRKGVFLCAACDQPVYRSETKFESGTGWPSFYAPIDGAIATSTDYKMILPRTEVHCSRCGGHLGHVFKDGPAPTGLRYCMNGVALKFKPGGEA